MINPQPDAGLQILPEFAFPVHCSRTMDLVNYGWYHGHFFAWAKQVYDATGTSALEGLWRMLVIPNVRELTDIELAALLQSSQPELAQLMQTWPAYEVLETHVVLWRVVLGGVPLEATNLVEIVDSAGYCL